MLTLKEAIEIVKPHIPKTQTLRESYAEAQGKYVFVGQFFDGSIPPGVMTWTVNKKTGECKCEYLEREGNKLWSPIRGYKKLELKGE